MTIHQFFLFCSGVEQSVLEQCPTDRNKYAGIGATIFFTGVLAFFSSAYALFTVFDSAWAAALFGLVWGLMIFNLDRYIVMSMKSRGTWWRDAVVALPRLALAVLLAVTISKPLELKIFDKEIQGELVKMEQELFKEQEDLVINRFSTQIEETKAQIAVLKGEIAEKTAKHSALVMEALQEADGTGGSKIRNMGPIYKAKQAEADKAALDLANLKTLNEPKIAALEKQQGEAESAQLTAISTLKRQPYDGMAARMEALWRLSSDSWAIQWASLFITLLFIAIETAPIFVKLISTRSPYDYLLHQHEHPFEVAYKEGIVFKDEALKNRLKHDIAVGRHEVVARIEMEKSKIDHKLKEKLEQLDSGLKVDWE